MVHITLSEVLASIIIYTIVHSVLWVARHAEEFAVTEYDHIIRQHVHESHKQKLTDCNRCGELSASIVAEAL